MKRRETSRRQSPLAPRARHGPSATALPYTPIGCVRGKEPTFTRRTAHSSSEEAKAGDDITDRVVKIRFWNKNTAIELVYKSFGLVEPEPDDAGRDVPTLVFPEGTRIRIE
jgi:hypothetical protein